MKSFEPERGYLIKADSNNSNIFHGCSEENDIFTSCMNLDLLLNWIPLQQIVSKLMKNNRHPNGSSDGLVLSLPDAQHSLISHIFNLSEAITCRLIF